MLTSSGWTSSLATVMLRCSAYFWIRHKTFTLMEQEKVFSIMLSNYLNFWAWLFSDMWFSCFVLCHSNTYSATLLTRERQSFWFHTAASCQNGRGSVSPYRCWKELSERWTMNQGQRKTACRYRLDFSHTHSCRHYWLAFNQILIVMWNVNFVLRFALVLISVL